MSSAKGWSAQGSQGSGRRLLTPTKHDIQVAEQDTACANTCKETHYAITLRAKFKSGAQNSRNL